VAAGELRVPVLLLRSARKCPTLAGRSAAPEISAGLASRGGDRNTMGVLFPIPMELRNQICPRGATAAVAAPDESADPKGPESIHLHPSGHNPGDPGRDRAA